MNNQAYNNNSLKIIRQKLRKNMPTPEILLWNKLRGKQLNGLKFRRQYSIGNYIIDFYCPERRLAIEIDGDSHYSAQAEIKDKKRDYFVEEHGITTLRFTNKEIINNLEGVLINILDNTTPDPSYLRRGNYRKERTS